MHNSIPSPTSPASRRFLLLPEEQIEADGQGRRIRRYRLASIGRRARSGSVDLASARLSAELGRLGMTRK